jgi:GntR family transcriptional regulator, transcriptional repressor for pyruvate dehydrogenase complex
MRFFVDRFPDRVYGACMVSDSPTGGQLKPPIKKSQSDQVVEILRDYIASDKIGIGDKLPPEYSLCEMLRVSRSTIREAIRSLSVMGYIEIINGRGSFLIRKEVDLPAKQIALWFSERKMELVEFIEVRQLIEPYAIQKAVVEGSPEELAKLNKIQAEYERELEEEGPNPHLAELDTGFHQILVDMAHNKLLSNLYRIVSESFRSYREHSFSLKEHAENAVAPHRKIIKAMTDRDVVYAKAYLEEHLEMVQTDMSFKST